MIYLVTNIFEEVFIKMKVIEASQRLLTHKYQEEGRAKGIKSLLKGHGLTPQRLIVMAAASDRLEMHEIVNLYGFSRANLSTITTTLWRKGYVRKERSSVDQRCVSLRLTDAGASVLSAVKGLETAEN